MFHCQFELFITCSDLDATECILTIRYYSRLFKGHKLKANVHRLTQISMKIVFLILQQTVAHTRVNFNWCSLVTLSKD